MLEGVWVRSTVRLQLCRRGSVVEDMGNKLEGLRREQGENESRGSRRKTCGTCTLEGGRERKAQSDSKSWKVGGEQTAKEVAALFHAKHADLNSLKSTSNPFFY